MAMAEATDINVDELRRRARRRLVGAVVLALGVAVVVPMLLETEQKPLSEDVAVKIPPIDEGKFENRLGEHRATDAPAPAAAAPADAAKGAAANDDPPSAPARTSKYDTHIPETPANAAAPSAPAEAPQSAAAPPPVAPPPTTAASPKAASPTTAASPKAAPPPTAASPKAAPQVANAPQAAAATAKSSEPRAADAPTHVSAAHDGFAVQLAAFADDKGANALAGRLKKAGYTAYTEPLKTSKGTLWRVRVGPYSSREAAVAARDKLKAEGQSGIVAAVK
jgi:DedD protein